MNKKIKKAFSLVAVSTTLMSGFSLGKACYGHPFQHRQAGRIELTEAERKEILYGDLARRLGLTVDEVANNLSHIDEIIGRHNAEPIDEASIQRITDEVIQNSAENLRTNQFWNRLINILVQNQADVIIAISHMPQDDSLLSSISESDSKVLRIIFRRLNIGTMRQRYDMRARRLLQQAENDFEHHIDDIAMYNAIINNAINADKAGAIQLLVSILETERLSELDRVQINNMIRKLRLLSEFPPVGQNPAQN